MMDLTSILIGLAADVGAPLVKDILDRKLGGGSGQLAETVIKTIATSAGTTVDQLPGFAQAEPAIVKAAIQDTEAMAPELIALYTAGLEGQFKLLQTESAEGPLQSGWRWGWMYLLGLFWTCYLVVFPIINAVLRALAADREHAVQIEALDAAILLTLTSWFIALYMGGHTLKELGKNAIDAVRSMKGGPV